MRDDHLSHLICKYMQTPIRTSIPTLTRFYIKTLFTATLCQKWIIFTTDKPMTDAQQENNNTVLFIVLEWTILNHNPIPKPNLMLNLILDRSQFYAITIMVGRVWD